jgi:putative transposase
MLSVVNEDGTTESGSLIDEIVREGARRMLAAALESKVDQYIAELAAERDERGHRLVVRNGHHGPRTVVTAAGPVEVTAPRVNDRHEATGEPERFSSRILARWCRKSPKISEVLPLLYWHGLSSGDFVPALEQFLGGSAGLSSASVTRLTRQWQDDHTLFQQRDLKDRDFVYVWADGVYPRVRLGQAHSCVLVLLRVRLDGTKELIAFAKGLRESTESWADLLRDCRRRGMRDPELVVGDGAMGLWKALAAVFPSARHQRCWVHKARNITNAWLPRTSPTTGTSCSPSTTSRPSTGSTCGPGTHRVHILHGQAADQDHPRSRQPGRRPRHGIQAGRVRPGTLARSPAPRSSPWSAPGPSSRTASWSSATRPS